MLRAALLLLLAPAVAAAQPPTRKLQFADEQTIHATIGYEIRTRDFAASRWLVYIAEPPELPSQTKVKVVCDPLGKIVAEKSPLARKVRFFDVPVPAPEAGGKIAVKQDITAMLRSRKLVPLAEGEKPPAVPPLTAAERKFYTAATKRYDFDKTEFKAWIAAKRLTREKNESPFGYVERVLAVLRSDFAYRYDPNEEKRASVSCSRNATDCGGMTILLVSAMRAHDIPARTIVGRYAKPRRAGTAPGDLDYDQPHVRAEFFAPGIGWVPVEPTMANRNPDKPLTDYIGNDPGDLLVLHVDFDLRLHFLTNEMSTDLLQIEPIFFATGRGKLDAFLGPSKWELKATPIAK
jgi:transglutaminase-like putative cysteine protease